MRAVRLWVQKANGCSWSGLGGLRGGMNRCADAGVGGATTDVAAHGAVDIGIAGRGILLEQRGRRHDLPRLAISALGDLQVDPCSLHCLGLLALQSLDGADLPPGYGR